MNIEPKELTAIFFLTNDEMRNRFLGELEKRDKMILELEANGREKEILRNAYNELESKCSEQKEIMRVLTEELVALKKRETAKRRRS